jgi:transcriptional regulator with XRE-family HTH domain
MTRRAMLVEDAAREWMKDPEFRAAYDALEDQFALASALIKARSDAGMTQEEVARAMGTTQAVVARLEGGRQKPSVRTLERFAKATHTRLHIDFVSAADRPGKYKSAIDQGVTRPSYRDRKRVRALG